MHEKSVHTAAPCIEVMHVRPSQHQHHFAEATDRMNPATTNIAIILDLIVAGPRKSRLRSLLGLT